MSEAGANLKEVFDAFYDLVVRWTRGLQGRKVLAAEWATLVDVKNFSMIDAAGTLWPTNEAALSSLKYGSGAAWLAFELVVRNFVVLQHDDNLCLVSFEIWQHVCVMQDSSMEEVTARRVTAWMKQQPTEEESQQQQDHVQSSRYVLVHLQETWIQGHGPKSKKDDAQQSPTQSTALDQLSEGTSSMQETWKSSNIPSRRRHISPKLDDFHAKPLLWDNQIVGISIKGWDIGTSQGPIGTSAWFNQATGELEQSAQYKLQNSSQHRRLVLPEMVFPSAHVALERAKGDLFLSWDAMDALKEWAEAHQAIPINKTNVNFRGVSVLQSSDAKLWKDKKGDHNNPASSESGDAVFHYDWTYSTPFCGKVYGSGSSGWKTLPQSGIPIAQLTDQSIPILLFDEVVLLQDDLHDNGDVQVTVKLRVMPTCAYILSKLFLRLDGVLLRLRECRLFVDFARMKLYRDITWREINWSDLTLHQLPTDVRAWTQDVNKETPAFLFLLSKLPLVGLPRDLQAHSEMKVVGSGIVRRPAPPPAVDAKPEPNENTAADGSSAEI
jgi:type 2A phosphatase activator TIP41